MGGGGGESFLRHCIKFMEAETTIWRLCTLDCRCGARGYRTTIRV